MSLDSLLVNTVTVKTVAYAPDAEGGQVQTLTTVGAFACNVQPARPGRTMDQGKDGERATHVVYFSSDPGVNVGDYLVWGSRVLIAQARVQDQSGRQRVYAVPCVERA